jgi:hypothetical protein
MLRDLVDEIYRLFGRRFRSATADSVTALFLRVVSRSNGSDCSMMTELQLT